MTVIMAFVLEGDVCGNCPRVGNVWEGGVAGNPSAVELGAGNSSITGGALSMFGVNGIQ